MSYPFIPTPKPFLVKKDNPFTFDILVGELRKVVSHFPDKRTGKNTRYSMENIVLSAFSLFFTQNPSFLQFQRDMKKAKGWSNAQTLFGVGTIPSDNHIRDILDEASPEHVYPVFTYIFDTLNKHEYLDCYRRINGDLLIAFDGTEYHNSQHIYCENCNITRHRNGTITYSHKAIRTKVVAPKNNTVISLEPEFIIPQDGHDKQDCEHEAMKRWLIKHGAHYRHLGITVLGDDLYCDQPMCLAIRKACFNFILVCLPESHKILYEWIDFLAASGDVLNHIERRWTGKEYETDTYRFVNDVPICDGEKALRVNWCEITTTKADGTVIYRNAFATNHLITKANIIEIVADGRSRWKTENENHNILKTKGYHIEHNFGHGEKYLASLFVTFNLLAFLFHTVLSLMDNRYQQIRQALGTRETFFDDVRALTRYICFESWDALLSFMIQGLLLPDSNSLTPRQTGPP
jgi:hypothetical protein